MLLTSVWEIKVINSFREKSPMHCKWPKGRWEDDACNRKESLGMGCSDNLLK